MDDTERDGHPFFPFFVPVHVSQYGTLALRTGRSPSGQRTGLAFTSQASLVSVLGPRQHWVRLCEQGLRDMLTPLGVDHITVDPLSVRSVAAGQKAPDRKWHVPAA